MEYLIICITCFLGSGLTLFSGFGLGTLLVPVFGIFFPIDIAIALTAIVHFLNNLLKLGLFAKKIDRKVLLSFGIPSILFAFGGAYILTLTSKADPLFHYFIGSAIFAVTPIKLTIGVLLLVFSIIELLPVVKSLSFDRRFLPLGGALSGFFGGLSGHQGALRSAFLLRLNLTKESFIATGVIIAVLIDLSRMSVYFGFQKMAVGTVHLPLLVLAILSAFGGVLIGNRLVKKMTIEFVKKLVSVFICIFALLLIGGII